jgi:chromate transporter
MTSEPSARAPHVSLSTLLSVFFRVGLASFGGSTAAFLYREVVKTRGWMSEEEFLAALTLSQVMPGANPVNMSLYIGSHLRGGLGGFVAAFGLVGPPFVVILILGGLYARYGSVPAVQAVLAGVVAVGVAMVLQLGTQLARGIKRIVPALIAATIFIAVGILNWPMIPVVIVLTPLSVGFELWMQASGRNG